jgi:ABC-type nitrate/sulfonate/bicarbonate transport system substrate-binding protein
VAITVRLGSFTPSVLLRVARHLDPALDVIETLVPSSPAQFQALHEGAYDVVLTSPDNVLGQRFSGPTRRVEMLAAIDRGMGLALYGRGELRGARVGVDVPASGFAFALYALAESLGVTRDEFEIVTLGSTPKRLKALLAGECDYTMLNAGNELHAEAAGFEAVARVSDICHPYLGTVLAALDPAPVSALTDRLVETAAAIVDGKHDDLVIAAASEALGLERPLAERYLRRLRDPGEGLVPDGVIHASALATVAGLRRRFA